MPQKPRNLVRTLRQWLLGVLLLGLLGSGIELLLLDHYEDAWQWVPLLLIGMAIAELAWHLAQPSLTSVRALQITMTSFLLAGLLGIGLHFRGAAAFQWDIDPSMNNADVFKKAIRAKAPPVLAPGIMLQLGLLGLVYTYRYDEKKSEV